MLIRKAAILGSVMLATLVPSTARADGLLSAFIGTTFGGDTTDEKVTYGASIAGMGGKVGFEADFGFSPNFFEPEAGDLDFNGEANVITVMGNLIIGANAPGAGVRPYAVGGIGLIRTRVTDVSDVFEDISRSSFGFDVGFGVNGFVSQTVGIKGDIRYFRALTGDDDNDLVPFDLADFDFWRATGGIVFRF